MTGAQYAELRKKLDLTQQQLAAKVGVAVSTIQAREQQPEKDVSSEAEISIRVLEDLPADAQLGAE